MSTIKRGKFILVEGFDGTGKSTLTQWIVDRYPLKFLVTPGGQFANARDHFGTDKASAIERFGFFFGENIRVSEYVREQTEMGVHILMERYVFSTFVYHDILVPGLFNRYKGLFSSLYLPDIVLLIRSDFDKIQSRIKKRITNDADDAFYLNEEMYQKVYSTYNYISSALNINLVTIENNSTFEAFTETAEHFVGSVIK